MNRWDPRYYQIAVLGSLLVYGTTSLEFEVSPVQIAIILFAVLLTQFLGTRLTSKATYDPRSALISGLSLCLLLRTNSLALAAAGAALAVGSKFVFRFKGKHLFNPTNFAIIVLIALSQQAWVSPGQWGSYAFFGFLMACLGGMVVNRAARWDVSIAFLAFYLGLVFARSYWLNEPWAIPLHRMENGALLLFAFFMISDPKTTPDSRAGRILFAALVAAGGAYVQFRMFRTNGLLWSLVGMSVLVPLIDWILPGTRYDWKSTLGKTLHDEHSNFVGPGDSRDSLVVSPS